MVNADSEVYSEVNVSRAVVRGPSLQLQGPARHLARHQALSKTSKVHVCFSLSGTSRSLEVLVSCSKDARPK